MIGAIDLLADWNAHMDMDWGAGGWILMGAMMIIFWGLVILGIVWIVRSVGTGHDHHGGTAVELLDRRLASGEISTEEYRERRDVLRGQETGGASGSEGN